MPIKTYVRPVTTVEAIQIDHSNIQEAADWIKEVSEGAWTAGCVAFRYDRPDPEYLSFFELEKFGTGEDEWAREGEWVVRLEDGTFITMSPADFDRDYQELETRA